MNSPESLKELPRPCDISTAVSVALRINDVEDADALARDSAIHQKSRTSGGPMCFSTKNVHPVLADLSSTGIRAQQISSAEAVAVGDVQFEMQLDSWSDSTVGVDSEDFLESPSNIEELDKLCKYIDGDSDEEPPEILDDQSSHFETEASQQFRNGNARNSQVARYWSPDRSPLKEFHSPLRMDNHKRPWRVELMNSQIWRQFDSVGTEMVITKNGRRMFPAVVVSISCLDLESIYTIRLNVLPVDNKRYKFLQTEWVPVGRADKKSVYKEYVHPDSPNCGSYWMEKPLCFKFIKLTNNKGTTSKDQVILNSMQKYQPCLRITCENDGVTQSYRFQETNFIAVTAYQNHRITQLKIDHNPYARAFRDGEQHSVDTEKSTKSKGQGGHCRRSSAGKKSTKQPHFLSSKRIHLQSARNHHTASDHLSSSPLLSEVQSSNCLSAISIESGFESEDGSENPLLSAVTHHLPETRILSQDSMYGCQLNYWPDDNSLYNSALITPPPLLDPAISFSEPYLQQTSQMVLDSNMTTVSPVKPLHGRDGVLNSMESTDDDVFM